MEPYEGPLSAARDFLLAANAKFQTVPPRDSFASSHYAIHSFVEALGKFRGRRGKISGHRQVAQIAAGLGVPENLVDAIGTVEGKVGAVYGREISTGEAHHALETANRLAKFIEGVVGLPGERVAVRRRRSDGVAQRYRVKRATLARRRP